MKKFVIRIFIICLLIYSAGVFISQQKMLNSYAAEKKQYKQEIAEENANKNDLTKTLDSLNSTEYIESIAREKLDMYLPNERVYVDNEK